MAGVILLLHPLYFLPKKSAQDLLQLPFSSLLDWLFSSGIDPLTSGGLAVNGKTNEKAQMPELRCFLHSWPSQPAAPEILFQTRMPQGWQSSKPKALAPKIWEPRLFPWAWQCASRTGMAQDPSGISPEKEESVTRSLVGKTSGKSRG
jgi:hypothetical protein